MKMGDILLLDISLAQDYQTALQIGIVVPTYTEVKQSLEDCPVININPKVNAFRKASGQLSSATRSRSKGS